MPGAAAIDPVRSADVARAFRIARWLRAGGVGVNAVGRGVEAPFGGCRRGGAGRGPGSCALRAYSETRAIVRRGWDRPRTRAGKF